MNILQGLLYACVFSCVTCLDGQALQDALLENHNRNIPPPMENGTVIAEVGMFLLAITNFDEISEIISTNSWFAVTWTDSRLSWNLEEYNFSRTYFRQEQIWHPDLTIINSAEEFKRLGYNDLLLGVTFDGRVLWEPGEQSDTICEVNTRFFPFDKQKCSILMLPWSQRRPESDVQPKYSVIVTGTFTENSLWRITSTSVKADFKAEFSMLTFELELTRRHEYYMTALIMPVLILSFLNCFAFILPYDSGEKMTYCTAILLSYTVLQTYTNDTLPRTSKHTSIFVTYISCMLGLSCVSVVCTLLGLLSRKIYLRQYESEEFKDESRALGKIVDQENRSVDNAEKEEEFHGRRNPCVSTKETNSKNKTINKRLMFMFITYFLDYFMLVVVCLSTVVITTVSLNSLFQNKNA